MYLTSVKTKISAGQKSQKQKTNRKNYCGTHYYSREV